MTVTSGSVAVGRVHSCATTASGGIKCWGSASYGQLGNGVVDSSSAGNFASPVAVTGITSGATVVAAGFGDHTCAIISGAVRCWGSNEYGQLGTGATSTTPRSTPAAAVNLGSGFTATALAIGEFHTCALSSAGAVRCWGRNDYGQLGHNMMSVTESATPVTPVGLTSGVRAIGAGRWHSCATLSSGGVKCWGSNLYGQIGNGSMGNGLHQPTDVMNLASVVGVSIAGSEKHTCVATSTGTVRCWGGNYDGELGNGQMGFNVDSAVPVSVMNIASGATQITCGYGFSCATVSGGVRCWGSNLNYVLGNNSSPSAVEPSPVAVNIVTSNVLSLAGGSSDHVCAYRTTGVWCWGSSGPHLGNGNDQDNAPEPVQANALP